MSFAYLGLDHKVITAAPEYSVTATVLTSAGYKQAWPCSLNGSLSLQDGHCYMPRKGQPLVSGGQRACCCMDHQAAARPWWLAQWQLSLMQRCMRYLQQMCLVPTQVTLTNRNQRHISSLISCRVLLQLILHFRHFLCLQSSVHASMHLK